MIAKSALGVAIGIILTPLRPYGASGILFDVKNKPIAPSPQEKFKKALASVLSASPEQIQESRALAKAEKPSAS